ncbi:MAG: hypothetical protein KF901_05425 [Myxococcales bacterium]|nr:hypothetical protein [Myxococcales bacterium]
MTRVALLLALALPLTAPLSVLAQPPADPSAANQASDPSALGEGNDDDGAPAESERAEAPTPAEPVALDEVPPPPGPETLPSSQGWSIGRWLVRSGGYEAAAFVLADPRVLVTAASAIRNGSPLRARNPETGVEVSAELIALDLEAGLALVRADAELEAPRPTGPTPRLGDRVVHQGTAPTSSGRGGGERWSLVLAARGPYLALAPICQTATPVFDVEGRVVAICTGNDRALAASALVERASPDAEPIARSAWRGRFGFDLRYRVQPDYEGVLNGELGFGLVGWDRLGFALRAGVAGGAEERGNTGVRLRARLEITGEVQLHHAFRAFNIPMRFVLGAGAVFRAQERRVTETFAQLEPGCDATMESCAIDIVEQTTTTHRYRVLPSARVELNLGGLALSYTVALDYDEWRASTHSLGVGFIF